MVVVVKGGGGGDGAQIAGTGGGVVGVWDVLVDGFSLDRGSDRCRGHLCVYVCASLTND